ncbi:MAG: sulfite exporter TauE/SafE family protein [Ramlibacter sp.]|nr:sulfite exporter TauE/SafE family protein [Ramlibacter sp.]
MSASLALTALLMGLAGGPHCAAMCGAACAGVVRLSSRPGRAVVQMLPAGAQAFPPEAGGVARSTLQSTLLLQAGRLLSYSAAGALAAAAVQSLAWVTSQAAALRPLWTLFHAGLLVWGLMLLLVARQPAWLDSAGRALWARVQPLAQAPGGLLATGALWAFLPCGLLYSALLVAALSGGPVAGALTMALFAVGSGLSLMLAPWLLKKLHERVNRWRQDWGTRLGGLVLVAVAGWALWMDLMARVAEWCR